VPYSNRCKTKDQQREFLKDLAKELCVPLIEARSVNQIVMRNHFLRVAIEMVLERRIVSPQEAAATSAMHRGIRGSTPIDRSCYFCRQFDEVVLSSSCILHKYHNPTVKAVHTVGNCISIIQRFMEKVVINETDDWYCQ